MSPRERRRRGAVESLGSVVLIFESIVVFLGGLVVYGLGALPAGLEPWWGVAGGIALAVLMLAVAGLLRHRWAVGVGWGLQALLALGGVLVPALLLVALIFGGMWAYATIKGAALDRRNAAIGRTGDAEPDPSANGD